MFIPEVLYTADELHIITRIRNLVGDEKEVFVDDKIIVTSGIDIKANGTMYELDESKGYPVEVYVNSSEVGAQGQDPVSVMSYKFLKFTQSGALHIGDALTVVYEHFRYSDLEIINAYDLNAPTYLVAQCGLTFDDLTMDLLILATAFIFLTRDLSDMALNAAEVQDSDSTYRNAGATMGASRAITDLLNIVNNQLLKAITMKTRCKILSLPVYKIE
jgi:hypothetical protein